MFTIVEKELFRWRRVRKNGREMSICTKLLVIGQIVFSSINLAVAGVTGEQITSGSATFTRPDAYTTNVNQATQRLDVSCQTISTKIDESINVFQPNARAVAIFRAIGGVPSEFRGALNANGRLFILNESGITFYGTSQVNVGALLATTARDVNADGDHFDFIGGGYGQVINHGNIHVSNGGFAVLAAPYVENTGTIQANLGQIQLASAKDFTVDLRGDGLIDFTVSKETMNAIANDAKLGVSNTGTLQAQSGTINISAGLASDIVQSVVNLAGVVDADAFGSGYNGGTVLVTSVGDTNLTGSIHADGGVDGNGGTIKTWADGTNRFTSEATITARGGNDSGDGGFVEVSGMNAIFRGTVNASAPNGKAGTLLIDPWAITIANGAGPDDGVTVYEQNIETTSVGGTNVLLVANHSITMNDLADDRLQGGSGSIEMNVTQGGTISFVDKNDTIATTTGKITMSAADGAEGAGTIDIGHLLTTGNYADITLIAGSGGITTGNLSTGGDGLGVSYPGDITLTTTNGGNISANNISIIADGGEGAQATLDINAAGDLNVGSIFVQALGESSWYGVDAEAKATLIAGGDITVTGDITVDAQAHLTYYDSASANANLSVNAGNDLSITGNTLVQAKAIQDGSYGWDDAHAYATADLSASHNIEINGDISVLAVADNEVPDANWAVANATLNVSAGNNITITGHSILVQADATRVASSGYGSGYGSAEASANATIIAEHNDATINSDITVQATAKNSGGGGYYYGYGYGSEYSDDANANANLNVSAGNDLSITGNVLVKADATRMGGAGYGSSDTYSYYSYGGAYGDADANAYASISAGNNVIINGPITVQSNALNDEHGASDASAYAYLEVNAKQDLSITGNILVKADATLGSGGTDTASADASAHFNAGNDMVIKGSISVLASAMNNGVYSSDASADAYLNANAGHDLSLTGNILVKADATLGSGGTDSADANAYAYLNAGNNLAINGNIAVQATALNKGTEASSASADANLEMSAGHDINVHGTITVQAAAECNNCSEDNNAYASAYLSGGHDITLSAESVTVTANATNNSSNNAYADATLDINAGNDINITGNTLVLADAKFSGDGGEGSVHAHADANADLEAGNNITITGNIEAQAKVLNEASYNAYDADATAGLDVYANNDLNIKGSILVKADAKLGGSASYDTDAHADASAEAYLIAGNNVSITGPITVEAKADNEAYGGSAAYASALLAAIAERGDLNIAGNTLVTADALRGPDGYNYYWNKSAEAGAVAFLAGGRNVTTVGTTTVTANAETQGYDGGEGAIAGAALVSLAGVNGNDLLGLAEDIASGYTSVGDISRALADGEFELPSFGVGNLHMTGDVLVTADSTSVRPDAVAGALALFAAGSDVTILTDPITVRANANETGEGYCYEGCPDAQAAAAVIAAAGLADGGEGGYHGNLYITGDILAAANASGMFSNEAVAGVLLYAPDDVTNLYATTPPTAAANSAFAQAPAHWADASPEVAYSETEDALAVVSIEAGGKVTIEPKSVAPSGCGRDECEVNNALEARRVDPIEPLPTGRDPLRIAQDGLVLWPTGAGVTAPSTGAIVTADMQSAIAAGADPTTLLPATAAGGMGLSAGLDAFSIGGTDYCDQVVSGFCLPAVGEKAKQ